jgi:DNA repair exonuclease SbcCD nuclease subunit
MGLRAVHISDTHLGFGAYNRVDPVQGINQREMDFYDAFERAIDKVVRLEPDIVIHSGDLFDTVRPQNRAIDFALKQLIRLSEQGIETVMISGNHSTPRLRETGNIFRIFDHLDHVHPVYEAGIEKIEVGDVLVHAVPHSTNPSLDQVVADVAASEEHGCNVLVLHAGISGSSYRMDEFNEQSVSRELLPDEFDYIALGHYHKFSEVMGNAYYSGSTERHSFSELGQSKGFLEVDLGSGKVKFHDIAVREMVELEAVDASDMNASDIAALAKDRMDGSDLEGRIVRMAIRNIAPLAARALDVTSIKRLGSDAMHFELKVERTANGDSDSIADSNIGSLAQEYQRFVDDLDLTAEDKERILELGIEYFTEEGK